MKISTYLNAAALAACFSLQTFTARAVLVTFENPTDLTANFTEVNGTGLGGAVQATGVGIGLPASGGVTLGTADRNYNLNTETFNLSATGPGSFTISSYFKPNGFTSSPTGLFLGFAGTAATNTTGADATGWFGMRVRYNAANTAILQGRTNDANVGSSSSFITDATNWYKFTLDVVRSATLNTFTLNSSIQNYGANGVTITGSPVNFSDTITNATLYTDTAVNAGFRAPSGNGVGALDNFEAVAIPEPGTAVLGALGIVGFAAMLRRRSQKS